MKAQHNKNILFFKLTSLVPLLIVLLFSFIFLAYFAYENYKFYTIKDKIQTTQQLINLSNELLKERTASSIYIVKQGDIDHEIITSQRARTDFVLSELGLETLRYDFENNLNFIRKKIDDKDVDFNDMFFNYYQNNINAISDYLKLLLEEFDNSTLYSKFFSILYSFNTIDILSKKRDFISRPMIQNRPLDDEELDMLYQMNTDFYLYDFPDNKLSNVISPSYSNNDYANNSDYINKFIHNIQKDENKTYEITFSILYNRSKDVITNIFTNIYTIIQSLESDVDSKNNKVLFYFLFILAVFFTDIVVLATFFKKIKTVENNQLEINKSIKRLDKIMKSQKIDIIDTDGEDKQNKIDNKIHIISKGIKLYLEKQKQTSNTKAQINTFFDGIKSDINEIFQYIVILAEDIYAKTNDSNVLKDIKDIMFETKRLNLFFNNLIFIRNLKYNTVYRRQYVLIHELFEEIIEYKLDLIERNNINFLYQPDLGFFEEVLVNKESLRILLINVIELIIKEQKDTTITFKYKIENKSDNKVFMKIDFISKYDIAYELSNKDDIYDALNSNKVLDYIFNKTTKLSNIDMSIDKNIITMSLQLETRRFVDKFKDLFKDLKIGFLKHSKQTYTEELLSYLFNYLGAKFSVIKEKDINDVDLIYTDDLSLGLPNHNLTFIANNKPTKFNKSTYYINNRCILLKNLIQSIQYFNLDSNNSSSDKNVLFANALAFVNKALYNSLEKIFYNIDFEIKEHHYDIILIQGGYLKDEANEKLAKLSKYIPVVVINSDKYNKNTISNISIAENIFLENMDFDYISKMMQSLLIRYKIDTQIKDILYYKSHSEVSNIILRTLKESFRVLDVVDNLTSFIDIISKNKYKIILFDDTIENFDPKKIGDCLERNENLDKNLLNDKFYNKHGKFVFTTKIGLFEKNTYSDADMKFDFTIKINQINKTTLIQAIKEYLI